MKRRFECPVHDDSEIRNSYSTDECGECFCFWDCKTGLEECLKDNDFKDCHDEIIEALNELSEKW